MKVTDLMIGDWLMFCERYGGIIKEYPVQVARIDKDDDLSNYKPVYIVSEILKKNGFEYIRPCDNYVFYNGNKNQIMFNDTEKQLKILIGFSIVFDNRVTYIHELQHTLKLCGIEKEIIL